MHIIWTIIIGFIAGVIAKFVTPGTFSLVTFWAWTATSAESTQAAASSNRGFIGGYVRLASVLRQ